jgi:6-phosphofructokinase
MEKYIGILTAGGDSPGLNAAIRGVGKAARNAFDMQVIGFKDGFRGMVGNRTIRLEGEALSGILTLGGTVLGTSRDKPHKMPVGDTVMDMTQVILDTYETHHLDALVCLGGGGTQKNAYRLMKAGLNVITLPKTIDNDVAMTDTTFGFDTALNIATEAIDRLHSTAHSHHRIIVVEVMGHNAGWLALGAGIAGGADVILIPEIAYNPQKIADAILQRSRGGKHFSIVAISEGAVSQEEKESNKHKTEKKKKSKKQKKNDCPPASTDPYAAQISESHSVRLARQLEELTGLESRVTILGHVQRGGAPSPADRLLATRLGTCCAELINDGQYGVMVAARGDGCEPVPLDQVAGNRKVVPLDHPWIKTAQLVGTNLGD